MKQSTYTGFMWQCSCGHSEYNEECPEECSNCSRIDTFVKLPEEIVEEREKELNESDLSISLKPKNKKIKSAGKKKK
ncbi:MAG: hypothetical protein AABW75_00575 [Nanoarchaeota archaeon]